jgi:hypothetical protein
MYNTLPCHRTSHHLTESAPIVVSGLFIIGVFNITIGCFAEPISSQERPNGGERRAAADANKNPNNAV